MTIEQLQNELEQHIDKYSLETVLECLARICHEKAEHIEVSYNDTNLAKSWIKKAVELTHIAF